MRQPLLAILICDKEGFCGFLDVPLILLRLPIPTDWSVEAIQNLPQP